MFLFLWKPFVEYLPCVRPIAMICQLNISNSPEVFWFCLCIMLFNYHLTGALTGLVFFVCETRQNGLYLYVKWVYCSSDRQTMVYIISIFMVVTTYSAMASSPVIMRLGSSANERVNKAWGQIHVISHAFKSELYAEFDTIMVYVRPASYFTNSICCCAH